MTRPFGPLAVLVALILTCGLCRAEESGQELVPGVPQRHKALPGSSPSFWISQPLAPSTQYEIRVSHPGPEAVSPSIVLTRAGAAAAGTGTSRLRRRLLDADKLVFVTNARGYIQHGTDSFDLDPRVGVQVAWRRLAPAAAGVDDSVPFPFDIMLEDAPLGVPRSALPAVAMAAAWVVLLWAGLHHRLLASSPHEA